MAHRDRAPRARAHAGGGLSMLYNSAENCSRLARQLAELVTTDADVMEIVAAFMSLQSAVSNYTLDPRLGPLIPLGSRPFNDIAEWHPADVRRRFPVSAN